MSPIYCFDTSVLINSWRKHYPHDLFPSVWDCLSGMCHEGKVIVPQVVYDELEVKGDDLFAWFKSHKSCIAQPNDEVFAAVKQILKAHGRLVDNKKNRSGADPFVIAHARVAQIAVVTEERESSGKSPRIPDVCKAMGVPCMSTIDLLRACGFKA